MRIVEKTATSAPSASNLRPSSLDCSRDRVTTTFCPNSGFFSNQRSRRSRSTTGPMIVTAGASNFAAAAVFATQWLAALFSAPFAGKLTQSKSAKRLCILCEWTGALCSVLIGLSFDVPYAMFGLLFIRGLAESTGKHGKGVVPIAGEPTDIPLSDDRIVVAISVGGQKAPGLDRLGPDSVLEREPLEALAADRQLHGFRHEGFWDCMDTYKDAILLNDLWESGSPPWRVWQPAQVR